MGAESERDMALDQLKKLQRRYESTEEELHKKRAELREALRNDAVGGGSNLPPSHAREMEFTSKKFSSALPKMDMKSPARVMEEKSCGESSRSTNSRSATPPMVLARPKRPRKKMLLEFTKNKMWMTTKTIIKQLRKN